MYCHKWRSVWMMPTNTTAWYKQTKIIKTKTRATSGMIKYSQVNIWSVLLYISWIILGYFRGNRDSGKSSSHFGQSNAGKLKSSGDSPKNPKMIKDVSTRKINRRHCKPALQQQGRKGKHAFYLVQSVANFHFYSSVFCYLQFGWLNSCVYCVFELLFWTCSTAEYFSVVSSVSFSRTTLDQQVGSFTLKNPPIGGTLVK